MTGQYRVILADPPWQYHAHHAVKPGQRVAEMHYRTVSSASLLMLPVADMAAKDAALFLWATMPCLPEAMTLMEAWGFTYKTAAFAWVKVRIDGQPIRNGLGHYTRSNAELCLLGLRGKPKRKARDVSQIILSRRRQHSRKPDEQYERIMRLFDGPYLEMFSRQQWPGWDTYGNQTDRFPAQPFLLPESMVSA